MIYDRKAPRARNVVALFLMAAIFLTSSMVTLAGGPALSGEIIVNGPRVDGAQTGVTLNGERALTGRTFFSTAVISTPDTNSATVNLGALGRVILSPNSQITLDLADRSISGTLASGHVQILNAEGVRVAIATPDDSLTNDASQAGDYSLDVTSGKTVATVEAGEAGLVNGAAAKMSKRKRNWYIFGIITAAVVVGIIIWKVTDDDKVTSPVR